MDDSKRRVTLRFLAQPMDVNFGGNVHGGTAMKWLDQAAYACATGWSSRYCVTAFTGDINFHTPIPVGNLVEVSARIIKTGRTSMHVFVELSSCNPQYCQMQKSIHCIMVFVAVDEQGKPVEVPDWTPVEAQDVQLAHYADKVAEFRKIIKAELSKALD